ncbi:MAG TPA: hypothetical protein VF188_10565 [Longimicrobiales bacterium]
MKQMFAGAGGHRRRRWIFAGIAGAAAIVFGVILLPWGAGPAALELVVLNPDGRYHESVRVPRVWTDTSGATAGAVMRVPLMLAVQNTGGEAQRPTRLELSVPARYRLVRGDGRPLLGRLTPGSPLVRYEIALPVGSMAPGAPPVRLPALDTLWLEPIIPSFYCVSFSDSVPEFVPAPPAPVDAISTVRIFYSFSGPELERRQAGLLTVELDPTLLRHELPEPPPVFLAAYREPEAPQPGLSALRYAGSRQAFCGEPTDPMELLVTLWETPAGGRFMVLDHGGAPRKYLFDLDRDSIIELEMWDPDADGDFEAWREARMPIPAFLLPPAPEPPYDVAIFASIPDDSLVRLYRYRNALAHRYEPVSEPPDTAARVRRLRPLVLRGASSDDTDRPPGITRRYWNAPGYPGGAAEPARVPSRIRLAEPRTPSAERGEPARVPSVTPNPEPRAPELAGRPTHPEAEPAPRTVPPAPTTEPDRQQPQPAEPGEPAAPQQRPTTAEEPQWQGPPPKLVGRPVDSIPPAARPDTTGPRR